MTNWDMRFLRLARHVSEWSKDPSTQTGAVVVDRDRRVVSLGFNGFPQGMADLMERYADREFKYAHIVHCERNAMLFAQRSLSGCTLYTWPFMSCSACAAMVIQARITRCVAPFSDNPRWIADFEKTKKMFVECGVELELASVLDIDKAEVR